MAVNPYKHLKIFSQDFVQIFSKSIESSPHIFAVAQTAYQNLTRDDRSQVILIR